MKKNIYLVLLLFIPTFVSAQEFNSVPLDHRAYDIIETAFLYGVCKPPTSAKPWQERTVRRLLWEIINDSSGVLTANEIETAVVVLESFDRNNGLDIRKGRFRLEGFYSTFETGLGWESSFSAAALFRPWPGGSVSTVNFGKIFAAGDLGKSFSWNVSAQGGFLYIDREERGAPDKTDFIIPSAFPYSMSKQWDGGVISLSDPGAIPAWPGDPALAGSFQAEINGVFFNDILHLRLGRIRRDWGLHEGTSLYMNMARPFLALEGTVFPLSWMNISFLGGMLEQFNYGETESFEWGISNILSLARVEFTPGRFFRFSTGISALMLHQPAVMFFTEAEFRLPGLFSLWGSLFIDRLDTSPDDFLSYNSTSFAYQGGIKTVIRWLPLAAFTLRYTKVEPYCYTGDNDKSPPDGFYVNSGESLGYYLPPNSDELLLRLESRFSPMLKAYLQFQMLRHGAEYGYGAVNGSSLRDILDDPYSLKFFLMDGVYKRNNIIKAGAEMCLKLKEVPFSFFLETGLVNTRFTINGTVGSGNDADYEDINDNVYRAGNSFVFSLGFRLFY